MLFNSIEFIFFFPITVILYFSLPPKYRWVLLLVASYYFYMSWRPEYALLILGSTLVDYIASIQMGKYKERRKRTPFLLFSLFTNLGLLFTFKYFNFFSQSLHGFYALFVHDAAPVSLHVLLPVGISFYTFQTLSYTIDVYRGDREPEKHFGIFAVYVSFFPQLVAGPIERSTTLLPQFRKTMYPDYQNIKRGLQLAAWGFLKKVVIADNLAIYVNAAYNNPADQPGLKLLLATYFFAFQIYCDFSGYSDIAIGTARVFGYEFMNNFERPYFSKSIHEFWRRWHISLSSWFRDYLYIPLGGNRVSKLRVQFNVFTVFLVSGLWHGANWTFVFWGALHGFYLLFSRWTHTLRDKFNNFTGLANHTGLHRLFKIIITFHLVLFAWIFFRAQSVNEAFIIISHIARDLTHNLPENLALLPKPRFYAFLVLFLIGAETVQEMGNIRVWINERPLMVRWFLYYALLIFIYLAGQFHEQQFIYFQF